MVFKLARDSLLIKVRAILAASSTVGRWSNVMRSNPWADDTKAAATESSTESFIVVEVACVCV